MAKSKVTKCVKCGHASIVRSNFKGLSDGRFYCNSDKRPACRAEWKLEHDYQQNNGKFTSTPSYNPIRW